MMKSTSKSLLAALVAGSLLSATALADDGALPPVQQADNIAYISGGIGSDEVAAIKAAARHYPLTIELAQASRTGGVFVADVDIAIRTAKGKKVFAANSSGPFMLVKLPPGSYRVEATLDGAARSQNVTIQARGSRHLTFVWPASAR